jgi:hypothetical protein
MLRTTLVIMLALSLGNTLTTLARPQEQRQEQAKSGSRKTEKTGVKIPGDSSDESPQRGRARDLVSATADEAIKWDDHRATVRALSHAADLLWDDNPDLARAWLVRAWDLTTDLNKETAQSDTKKYRSSSPQAAGRATVLAVAQRRDKRLADRLIEQLNDEKEQAAYESQRGIFDDRSARSEQLLNMALASVESDPALAVSLAERSLADGISFQLQSVLIALRKRDVNAANRVFDAALASLASRFAHASEGQVIASYLFTPGRVFGAGSSNTTALALGTQTPTLQKTPAEADPTRARRFLTIMQQILLSMPAPSTTPDPSLSAQEFVTLAGSLADGFKAYSPDLWLPIEQRLTQFVQYRAPAREDNRLPPSFRDRVRSGSTYGASEEEINRSYVESLEEAADKEDDPIARKLAYVQAALATTPEDLARGRHIAAKIEETELRKQVVSFLTYRAALVMLEKGQLGEAITLASEAQPLQHAVILITAAQRIVAERPKREEVWQKSARNLRALDLLYNAEKLLKKEYDDGSSDALRIQMGLVAALAPLDTLRALDALSGVVVSINKSDSFDLNDSGAPRPVGLDGFAAQSLLPRVRSGYGIKDALAPLALADFEGTVSVVKKISAPAARGEALLEIAKTILDAGRGNGKR